MSVKKILTICLIVLPFALGSFLVLSPSSDAETIAGNFYHWEDDRDDNRQAICDSMRLGTDCVGLCYNINGVIAPQDRYCCIDPTLLGGQDNPQQCDLWVD